MAPRKRNRSTNGAIPPRMPVLAMISGDEQLAETIGIAAAVGWTVARLKVADVPSLIREPNVRLVIFDDDSVSASDRGRTLSEIRHCAPNAPIIYVASEHDHESEKLARARGVLFYTAKPLVQNYVDLLLQRQLQMHNGKSHLANPQAGGQG